jgi:hypothetical protein
MGVKTVLRSDDIKHLDEGLNVRHAFFLKN